MRAIIAYFPISQSNHLYHLYISKEHIILNCITSHNHKKDVLDGRNYFQPCKAKHSSLHAYCHSLSDSEYMTG